MNQQKTSIHHSIRLITTVVFSTVVISFGKYEITRLMPFFIFPLLLYAYSNMSLKVFLKKLLMLEPFVLGIGILNPIFEDNTFMLYNFELSMGFLSFISLVIRSTLILMAAIMLAESLQLEEALVGLKMPHFFVTQITLTYRYIGLLTKEIKAVVLAYGLRSTGEKRIKFQHMGSILGHFFLRTLDKANAIHQAMLLRGFDGEHNHLKVRPFKPRDLAYALIWSVLFAGLRIFDVNEALGQLILGGNR